MTRMSVRVFVLGATAAALVGGAALLTWFAGDDALAKGWATTGFLAMALPGIAAGAWRTREHGRAESRFVIAVLAGILVRLVVAAIVVSGAAREGGSAMTGLPAGLFFGFVPLMAFETAWFARSLKSQGASMGTRG